jgi:hypothetical protein
MSIISSTIVKSIVVVYFIVFKVSKLEVSSVTIIVRRVNRI